MKTPFNESATPSQEEFDATPTEPYLRPTRRGCFGRLVRTAATLAALGAVSAGSIAGILYWHNVSEPIDVENASTGKLVGWLALRDLSAETPETRERLFERYVATLGGEGGDVEPQKIEIPEQAKRLASRFLANLSGSRSAEEPSADAASAAKKNAARLPVLRLDYYVAPRSADSPLTSEFVLSEEVRPGPALLKRWNASREARENGVEQEKTSAVEKNIRLLVLQWFVAKRRDYDAAPDAQKAARLQAAADELLGWQELYGQIQLDATRTGASRVALLAEFEKTVASWNAFDPPEELAKTLWFKDLIVATLAARETPFGRLATPTPPRARRLETDEPTTESNAARDLGRRTLDAARRFLFQSAETDAPSR